VEGWRPVEDIVRWGFALVVSTDNELTGPLPAESGPTEDEMTGEELTETPLTEDGA
jgi:hypothetical protein